MKHIGTILMLVVVYAIASVFGKSCGSTAAKKHLESKYESSKVDRSLLTFKKELKRTEKYLEAYQKSIGNPLLSIKTLAEYNNKMSSIKTSGLPGDIVRTFSKYKTTHKSLLNHLNNTPFPTELISGGTDAVSNWVRLKSEKDPEFLETYMTEMREWEKVSAGFQKKVQDSTYDFSMALLEHNLEFNFEAGAEWLRDKL